MHRGKAALPGRGFLYGSTFQHFLKFASSCYAFVPQHGIRIDIDYPFYALARRLTRSHINKEIRGHSMMCACLRGRPLLVLIQCVFSPLETGDRPPGMECRQRAAVIPRSPNPEAPVSAAPRRWVWLIQTDHRATKRLMRPRVLRPRAAPGMGGREHSRARARSRAGLRSCRMVFHPERCLHHYLVNTHYVLLQVL